MTATATISPPAPPVPAPAGLTPEQVDEIRVARIRARAITKAAGIATFSGWTMAVFAGFSLLGGIFGLRSLFVGLALTAVTVIELRGAKALRGLDVTAPARLAFNQIGLFIAVLIYAGWGMAEVVFGPSPYAEHLAAGGPVADAIAPIDELTRILTAGFYVVVIVSSFAAQGGMAAYYATRRRHIHDFTAATPDWVLRTIKAAWG